LRNKIIQKFQIFN